TPKGTCEESVKIAIDAGYRHIDGAFVYYNEHEVGQAIWEKIAEGKVKREEIFYCGKLWNTCHPPELVRPTLEKTLKILRMDYVDLYIIELPMAFKALEACKDAGLAKSIGVSNFNRRQLEMILNKPGLKHKPVSNQDPVLNAIGEKYNKTAAQVVLRFNIQRGVVVIPKSFHPQRIKENFQIFDFSLTGKEMKDIEALNKNTRYVEMLM
ncbi:3-oxo-5-beta-steroid 4-dehydrogenase, partial [Chelonia mydas]